VLNPRQRPAAVIELRAAAAGVMPDMPVVGAQPRPPLEVEVIDSLVRGDADLFSVRHADPARLSVKQAVVALQGTLLAARGNSETMYENSQLELRLEHVTSVLGGGLIRFDSGNTPRKLLPLQVSASDSIFNNIAAVPLISMVGNAPPQDFRALLSWSGQHNFYDRYQTLWSITAMEETGVRSESWDSREWRRWTEASEPNPRFDSVVWKNRAWMVRPFAELTAADFALDRQAAINPAVSGATNLSDAGANLERLPRSASAVPEDR
jgi:hypothetical protein